MDIGDALRNLQQVLANKAVDPQTPKADTQQRTTAEKTGHAVEEVHVSVAANLATEPAQTPDVRMEKVAPIQRALAAGRYKVSDSDIAMSLINHMLQRQVNL